MANEYRRIQDMPSSSNSRVKTVFRLAGYDNCNISHEVHADRRILQSGVLSGNTLVFTDSSFLFENIGY